jgi:NAD(P)H-flavin reductase
LRRMAEWGEDHPTTVFLGVNNEQEIFCQQELAELTAALPQLKVELCVWQASDNWQGFVGTPADALRLHLAEAALLPDIFLCGPPLLVEAATEIAHRAGIAEERIFCERFT